MTDQRGRWRQSSYCGTNACVEVSFDAHMVYLRDSKRPGEQPLMFTHAEWKQFIAGVFAGEFGWPEEAEPAPDPACERHGCKHPMSRHTDTTDPQRPCEDCGCRGFSGWSGQQGRAGATA